MAKEFKVSDWRVAPEILEILKPHWDRACSTLQTLYEWSKHPESELGSYILTPGGIIDKYGTFALVVPEYRNAIFFTTANPDTTELRDLFLNSAIIDWSETTTFGGYHQRFVPMIDEIVRVKEMRLEHDGPNFCFVLDIDIAKNMEVRCPDDVYLSALTVEDGLTVAATWPRADGDKSLHVVRNMIMYNGGLGLFSKETKELLSWSVINYSGVIGLLQTAERHLRKGYGTIIIMAMAKLQAEKGFNPTAVVHCDNHKSRNLFLKLGFKNKYDMYWTYVNQKL